MSNEQTHIPYLTFSSYLSFSRSLSFNLSYLSVVSMSLNILVCRSYRRHSYNKGQRSDGPKPRVRRDGWDEQSYHDHQKVKVGNLLELLEHVLGQEVPPCVRTRHYHVVAVLQLLCLRQVFFVVVEIHRPIWSVLYIRLPSPLNV